jgi:hypothetical protein
MARNRSEKESVLQNVPAAVIEILKADAMHLFRSGVRKPSFSFTSPEGDELFSNLSPENDKWWLNSSSDARNDYIRVYVAWLWRKKDQAMDGTQ